MQLCVWWSYHGLARDSCSYVRASLEALLEHNYFSSPAPTKVLVRSASYYWKLPFTHTHTYTCTPFPGNLQRCNSVHFYCETIFNVINRYDRVGSPENIKNGLRTHANCASVPWQGLICIRYVTTSWAFFMSNLLKVLQATLSSYRRRDTKIKWSRKPNSICTRCVTSPDFWESTPLSDHSVVLSGLSGTVLGAGPKVPYLLDKCPTTVLYPQCQWLL